MLCTHAFETSSITHPAGSAARMPVTSSDWMALTGWCVTLLLLACCDRRITCKNPRYPSIILQHKGVCPGTAADGTVTSVAVPRITIAAHQLMAHLVYGPYPDKYQRLLAAAAADTARGDGGRHETDALSRVLREQRRFPHTVEPREWQVVCHHDHPADPRPHPAGPAPQRLPLPSRCCSRHCICPLHLQYDESAYNGRTGRAPQQLRDRQRRHSWEPWPLPPGSDVIHGV